MGPGDSHFVDHGPKFRRRPQHVFRDQDRALGPGPGQCQRLGPFGITVNCIARAQFLLDLPVNLLSQEQRDDSSDRSDLAVGDGPTRSQSFPAGIKLLPWVCRASLQSTDLTAALLILRHRSAASAKSFWGLQLLRPEPPRAPPRHPVLIRRLQLAPQRLAVAPARDHLLIQRSSRVRPPSARHRAARHGRIGHHV